MSRLSEDRVIQEQEEYVSGTYQLVRWLISFQMYVKCKAVLSKGPPTIWVEELSRLKSYILLVNYVHMCSYESRMFMDSLFQEKG